MVGVVAYSPVHAVAIGPPVDAVAGGTGRVAPHATDAVEILPTETLPSILVVTVGVDACPLGPGDQVDARPTGRRPFRHIRDAVGLAVAIPPVIGTVAGVLGEVDATLVATSPVPFHVPSGRPVQTGRVPTVGAKTVPVGVPAVLPETGPRLVTTTRPPGAVARPVRPVAALGHALEEETGHAGGRPGAPVDVAETRAGQSPLDAATSAQVVRKVLTRDAGPCLPPNGDAVRRVAGTLAAGRPKVGTDVRPAPVAEMETANVAGTRHATDDGTCPSDDVVSPDLVGAVRAVPYAKVDPGETVLDAPGHVALAFGDHLVKVFRRKTAGQASSARRKNA